MTDLTKPEREAVRTTLLGLCVALASCAPYSEPEPNVDSVVTDGAWSLQRVAQFHDDYAYGGWRCVYILRDTRTGREWVGVSGIGISELAAHPIGKVRVEDER